RAALQRVLAGIRQGTASVDAYYSIPSVQSAPELQAALSEMVTRQAELRALESRYTAEYEPVQNLRTTIQELRGRTIPQLTTALIQRLAAQERQLGGQIAGAERELQEIPARTIEESRLRREVQIQDNLYNTLQARYEEARLAEASAIPDVRVLDPAVAPQAPSRDQAPRVLLMAFLASFGTAVGSAVLLGQVDKRFRYPEQATHELGLAILGAVPGMGANAENDPEKAAQMLEAFRSIRLNIAYSYGAAGPVIVAVSSPNSGDGKSFIASNLALSYAEAGHRTLLVDGDIRQGDLHRTFRTDRRPGLTDYLAGDVDENSVIRATNHANLSFIASGTRDRRGPELLGSGLTGRLFAALKNRFEVIIVDTPPLSAGVDPFVLGTATGHMVLVLRSGETDRKLAAAKLETLDQLPIRLLGAVLNDIRAEGAYLYYAYDYAFTGEELDGGNGKSDRRELAAPTV
ncbi:MAG: polysaccharide biosynthesis tyrosine autokinase, partial [Gemmatimonadota bacterium]|nr:polysaccharide biosynthesis tyrosine autokinase [Gemmatimonadota bacterium]